MIKYTSFGSGIVAGILIAVAFLVGPLNLDLAEDFVFFRLFNLTRTDTAHLGLVLAGVSISLLVVSSMWRSRRVRQNTILVCASMALSIFILEVTVRLIDGVSLWPLRNIAAERSALLTIHTANVYHPVLGWILKAGISSAPSDPENSFTTGAHGIRMNTPAVQPLPTGGVLAVGDSFTAGSEVGDRYSWPANLERLLKEPVVNAGVGGWATDQIVLRAEEMIRIVRPRAVVVSFLDQDILRAGYRVFNGGNKPWFSMKKGKLRHHNNPVPVVQETPEITEVQILGYIHLFNFVLQRTGHGDWWRRSNTRFLRTDSDPVRVTCALLDRLKRRVDAAGVRLLFVLQYGGYNRLRKMQKPEHAKFIADCARDAGIETLDTWAPLVRANEENLAAYRRLYVLHDKDRVFGHMSSEGNAFIARLIAERLKRRRGP